MGIACVVKGTNLRLLLLLTAERHCRFVFSNGEHYFERRRRCLISTSLAQCLTLTFSAFVFALPILPRYQGYNSHNTDFFLVPDLQPVLWIDWQGECTLNYDPTSDGEKPSGLRAYQKVAVAHETRYLGAPEAIQLQTPPLASARAVKITGQRLGHAFR